MILNSTGANSTITSELSHLFRATPAVAIPATLLEPYLGAYPQGYSERRIPLYEFQEWLAARAESSPEDALIAVEIAVNLFSDPAPFAWDADLYPKLLTRLLREGEELEPGDEGKFLRRVIRVQDALIRGSDHRVNEWLAEAERP